MSVAVTVMIAIVDVVIVTTATTTTTTTIVSINPIDIRTSIVSLEWVDGLEPSARGTVQGQGPRRPGIPPYEVK